MMTSEENEIVWHDDQHKIILQLNRSELKILSVICPNKDKDDSPCRHPDAPCVVEWFLLRYGFECNVGVCQPMPELTVAWGFVGEKHREIESGQVWIIPTNDEAFAAWLISQRSDS